MKRVIKINCIFLLLALALSVSYGQVGVGVTYGFDFYQYQANPKAEDVNLKRGLGSALLNFNIGPKLYFGGNQFSVTVEGQLGIAPFAFDLDEYKGLGAFYFPILAAINFKGLSGFYEKSSWGFGFAGGTEFVRTDLYFLDDDFKDLTRSMFNTYFGQVNVGLGSKASSIFLYARYGVGADEARNFHIGIMLDQNLTQMKKLKKRQAVQ